MFSGLQTSRMHGANRGVTLIELVMAIMIFGLVMVVINQVFFTTNRLYGRTTIRAGQQMNGRAGVDVMVSELRTAGCDPGQRGIVGIVAAASDSVDVQADFNDDGVIQTAEPSEHVIYYYDAGQQAVMRDSGTGPQLMITDVSSCVFTYFDETNQAIAAPVAANQVGLIRSIGIQVTTQTARGGTIATQTRVGLRNG